MVSLSQDQQNRLEFIQNEHDVLNSPDGSNSHFNSASSGMDVPGHEKPLSKNQLRKQKVYEKKLISRAKRRAKERLQRKLNRRKGNRELQAAGTANNKNPDEKTDAAPCADTDSEPPLQKLPNLSTNSPNVVIDCQYEGQMSLKEQSRFAQQLRRLYSSNRKSCSPLQLHITSLDPSSNFYKICCKQNDGFAKYSINMTSSSFMELFSGSHQQIVYLSPDSPNLLESIEPCKIYIIGGLVDETVTKNASYDFASQNSISTAKLPIDKYFCKSADEKKSGGTFKQVLTVNQVFDILLKYHETQNWTEAIQVGLPQRTGLVPLSRISEEDQQISVDTEEEETKSARS